MFSALAFASPSSQKCVAVPPEFASQPEMTISEIESQRLKAVNEMRKITPEVPQLPFGFANEEWLAFKKLVRPGDKIIEYSSDITSWQNKAGDIGYALIRSGCILKVFRGLRS
jgi:hypothetical protein